MSLVSEWLGFWGWEARAITVSRMQDKIVETRDGALHIVLNLGPFNGLRMYTSSDNGLSWHRSFRFDDTDGFSTAHLELMPDGRSLGVSFQGADREVFYQELTYLPRLEFWWPLSDPMEVIAPGGTARVGLPNHVHGADGVLYSLSMGDTWFVPEVNIAASIDEGATWELSEISLTGHSIASVRAVSTPDVTGVIIATDSNLSWYEATAPNAPMVEISEFGSFAVLASHYSITVVGNDIFLANVTTEDSPQLELFVYDGDTRIWSELEVQNTFTSEAYVQISSNPEGHLYLTFDDYGESRLRVLESLDGGRTWEIAAEIDVEDRVEPALTRMTAPEYFTEDLVIFQMVQPREGSDFYGVSSVTVDVDGDNSALGEETVFQREQDAVQSVPRVVDTLSRDDPPQPLEDYFSGLVAEDSLL